MSEQPQDGVTVHDEAVTMIADAVDAAVSTASGQMGEARAFLESGVGSAPPEGLREPVKPGPADAPAT